LQRNTEGNLFSVHCPTFIFATRGGGCDFTKAMHARKPTSQCAVLGTRPHFWVPLFVLCFYPGILDLEKSK